MKHTRKSSSGDEFARFVELLTRHQSDLWAFIFSQLPGHPDVADILQKTNVILWLKRGDFEPGSDFLAWAFSVARYEVRAHLKEAKRANWLVFNDELLETISAEAPEQFGDGNLRLKWLGICLGKLRPAERQLVEHRYESQEGLAEYAARSGRSVSSLSVTLHRVRAALRACIEKGIAREGNTA